MRTSSLCSVQVPGVWVPWLWAYCGEISFYWLSSGTSQLCIWLYIPYQVIFQDYFWIKTHHFVPQINNSKCVPNQCHPPDKQTKRCNKTSKGLWGFLVGFLKLPWTFYVHHIFCVPDWNFELSSLLLKKVHLWEGPPWWLSGKESACQCGRLRYHPWVGNIPCRRKWQSTQVFLLGKSHEPRSLVGCSPWGCERVGLNVVTKQQQQIYEKRDY